MGKTFFDFDADDFSVTLSDTMGMRTDGNLMMRMSNNMAMDMDSGDINMI